MTYKWPENNGKFLKPPKIGAAPILVRIKDVNEVKSEDGRFNFMKDVEVPIPNSGGKMGKVKQDAGWHLEIVTQDDKTMNVSNWGLYYALCNVQPVPGMTIKISHPEKGNWKVEVISQAETGDAREDTEAPPDDSQVEFPA